MTDATTITVRYSSIDRFRQSRKFKTLAGAQKYAHKMVGETPEVSTTFGYAVSASGVGKVTCEGCKLIDLFPKLANDPCQHCGKSTNGRIGGFCSRQCEDDAYTSSL